MKNYKLIESDKIEINDVVLYRIKATKDFSVIIKGTLGGYIEKYENLTENAWVYQEAHVMGNACVSGHAYASGQSSVSGHASVSENACVSGNARVTGNAYVSGHAYVHGNAIVLGDAIANEDIHLRYGITDVDTSGNQATSLVLRNSLQIIPIKNKVILYKRVNKIGEGIYASGYDSNFIYQLGKTAKAIDVENSMESCASGLHASTPDYWKGGDTLIAVEIDIKDIITVQRGRVRCSKLKVIAEI